MKQILSSFRPLPSRKTLTTDSPARQWGERFPVRATAFAEEAPHAREVLAESRTMKGGGVATLGAAGVEVAQNVLAETQSAVLPLVPYLDTRRWVFIAVAGGVICGRLRFCKVFVCNIDQSRLRSFVRPVCAAHMTAGLDEVRVPGPNQTTEV